MVIVEQIVVVGTSLTVSLAAVEYRLWREQKIETEDEIENWLASVRETTSKIIHLTMRWDIQQNESIQPTAKEIEDLSREIYQLGTQTPECYRDQFSSELFTLAGEIDQAAKLLLLFSKEDPDSGYDAIMDDIKEDLEIENFNVLLTGMSDGNERSAASDKDQAIDDLRMISLETLFEQIREGVIEIEQKADNELQEGDYQKGWFTVR